MLTVLSYVGDAMWILVMAAIASTSRAALRRIPREARVPTPLGRAPRDPTFFVAVALPLASGLVLLALGKMAATAEEGLLIFLLRAFTAPLFALAHLLWLRAALRTLDEEGALKP